MSETAYIIQFLCPYIVCLILIIIFIVWICIWAVHYIRKEQICNPQRSKRKIKGEAFLLAFLKYTLNRSSPHLREDPYHWRREIWEFKRECEIAELKHRKCRAKLPERPDWKCTCGRINLAHTVTCVCGKNMRDIPIEIRTNISEDELSWKCLCGLENAGHTSICSCGGKKQDVPFAVRTPTMKALRAWSCSCGRENPGYTYTCVCGKSKQQV